MDVRSIEVVNVTMLTTDKKNIKNIFEKNEFKNFFIWPPHVHFEMGTNGTV